jgi:hypothetical protein
VSGLLRRWRARRGTLPAPLRAELEAEGLQLLEERIPCHVTYRHYVALGQRAASGTQSTIAALALTPRRLVIRGTQGVQLDAPPGTVAPAIEGPGLLVLSYEAEDIYPTRSGRVELRLRTQRADEIHARLTAWTETPSN